MNHYVALIVLLTLSKLIASPQTAAPRKRQAAPAAQASAVTPPPMAAPEKHSLNVEVVIKMLDARLSESIIASSVRKNAVAFDLTPDQMIRLKKAGSSDMLIAVMLDPSTPYVQPAPVSAPLRAGQLPLRPLQLQPPLSMWRLRRSTSAFMSRKMASGWKSSPRLLIGKQAGR